MGQDSGFKFRVYQAFADRSGKHDGLAGIMGDREIAHEVSVIAIDGEPEIFSPACRVHGEAGAQHVLFLLARHRLFAKNSSRDSFEVSRDMDPVIDLAIDLFLAQGCEQTETSGDKYKIFRQPS